MNKWHQNERVYIRKEQLQDRGKLITSDHLRGIESVSVNKHLKLQLSSFVYVCVFVSVMCNCMLNS